MIIFFYGPDTFRSSQKVKEIIDGYKAKHKSGLNFSRLEWAVDSLARVKEIISSVSMFDEKKLVVVYGVCLAPEVEQEKLIELIDKKDISKDEGIIMVFFEKETQEKSVFSQWLIKKTKMAERFDYLTGAKLSGWIKKETEKSGGQISSGAVEKLIAFVGSDLWQMKSELLKLAAYSRGAQITEKDIDFLVKSKIDSNIFATIDALAARNKNLAYKFLHQHLSQGENEIYILTMFVYQFRNLLQIKNLVDSGVSFAALAKKTGLHPFVIKKSWQQLGHFSQDVLKRVYERLLELDIAIKRGRIEPQAALDLIVAEIAG